MGCCGPPGGGIAQEGPQPMHPAGRRTGGSTGQEGPLSADWERLACACAGARVHFHQVGRQGLTPPPLQQQASVAQVTAGQRGRPPALACAHMPNCSFLNRCLGRCDVLLTIPPFVPALPPHPPPPVLPCTGDGRSRLRRSLHAMPCRGVVWCRPHCQRHCDCATYVHWASSPRPRHAPAQQGQRQQQRRRQPAEAPPAQPWLA